MHDLDPEIDLQKDRVGTGIGSSGGIGVAGRFRAAISGKLPFIWPTSFGRNAPSFKK
jgi:hypothetical protein